MIDEPLSTEDLLDEALRLSPEQRAAFLERACAATPNRRSLIEQLLEEEDLPVSFLGKPAFRALSGQSYDLEPPAPLTFVSPPRFGAGDLIADRFLVIRLIARGGMGEVYEVHDQFLHGTPVALKIIRPHIAGDPYSSHRFEQEVLLARRVHHRHLCPIYDIFRSEVPAPPFVFLTMKLLAGESLEARLKEHPPLPLQAGVAICSQLLQGINALHMGGIIHGDIKPNNVMLEPCGSDVCATIMDFGLARLSAAGATQTWAGLIAGTPGYLAPEMIQGVRPSPASDLYALGVVMHQILTGQTPSVARSGEMKADLSALQRALVPLALVEAISGFLSKDPEKRCGAFARIVNHAKSSEEPRRALSLSRRSFVTGSVATLGCVTGGALWKREQIYDFFHPLPKKRFVALLHWPASSDTKMAPMVLDLIDKMTSALSRAEALDHDFFVASQRVLTEMKTPQQVSEVCESLGANLILATSGSIFTDGVRLILEVISKDTLQVLRSRRLQVSSDRVASMPALVTHAAAQLLDVAPLPANASLNQIDTKNPEALAAFQAGQALLKEPNYQGVEAAIEKFKVAVETDTRFANAHARLAFAYFQRFGAHHDATSLLLARANAETALTLNPDCVEGHSALACSYEVTGDLPQALREFGKALAIDPLNSHIAVYQAQAYFFAQRWKDAEDCFKQILKAHPNYWYPYNELANTYSFQGKYKQALKAYQAATLTGPSNVWPVYGTALMLFLLGDLDGADLAVSKALSLAPFAAALHVRVCILLVRAKLSESLRIALQATQMDAGDVEGWLRLGDVYGRMKRDKDAEEAYKHALSSANNELEMNPSNRSIQILCALLQCKLGDRIAAKSSLQRAEDKNVGDIYALLYKVRLLELLKRREEALSAFALCLKMGATPTQLKATDDLEALARDPRYYSLIQASSSFQSPVA